MFSARLEANRIKAGEAKALGLLVEATAPQLPQQQITRSPQALVFVVDRSGSMGGGRLDLIKNTIGELIGQLSPSDFVSILSFDTAVEVHVPISAKSELDIAEVRRELVKLEPRGRTDIELGFRHGLAEAAKAPSGVEAKLVLLSDGHANNGIKDPVQLGQLAALATEHLVTTSTIGIGTGFDERILSSIASSGRGNHFAAVKVDEAVAGLQDEIDGLLQRSVRDLSCRILVRGESPLKAIRSVGYVRNQHKLPQGVEVGLGELVSGEERGYAFALEFAAFEKSFEGSFDIDILVTGRNALTDEPISELISLQLEVANPVGFVAPEIDEDVVAELAVFKMADLKSEAASAAQAGSYEEARKLISEAQSDTAALLRQLDKLSPRVRLRVLAENRELAELLGFTDLEFAKRATESSYRSSRSKANPRDKN